DPLPAYAQGQAVVDGEIDSERPGPRRARAALDGRDEDRQGEGGAEGPHRPPEEGVAERRQGRAQEALHLDEPLLRLLPLGSPQSRQVLLHRADGAQGEARHLRSRVEEIEVPQPGAPELLRVAVDALEPRGDGPEEAEVLHALEVPARLEAKAPQEDPE